MAIQYSEGMNADGKPNAIISIDNGDLQALKQVMEAYGFVNQQALLRYALVSLITAGDNQLYVRDNGNIVAMKIADALVNKPSEAK